MRASNTIEGLVDVLSAIPEVDALYMDDGVVYVVVEQHDDVVYERLIDAEDALRAEYGSCDLRVRAHQGRVPARTVPDGSENLFLRRRGPVTEA